MSKFSGVLCLVFLVSFTAAQDVKLIKRNPYSYKRYTKRITLDGCYEVRPCPEFGSNPENPAPSCKAILDNDKSAPSGPYYIKTGSTTTKVYCYMEDILGCGGGGWTTVMKINGSRRTFEFDSAFWTNKKSYGVKAGQSGADEQETKLPTYWTLPFTKLCLGMKTQKNQQPNWISVNYTAKSLYSVIADGKNHTFSIGRSKWKSLIPGSSLQRNCNLEGFNLRGTEWNERVRIGIIGNEQYHCRSPDSTVAFGFHVARMCYPEVTTGNCALHQSDNGDASTPAYGFILAQ